MSSIAANLFDAAKELKHSPGLILCSQEWEESLLNRLRLALDLRERSGLAFAAQVEDWDIDRIVRELRV